MLCDYWIFFWLGEDHRATTTAAATASDLASVRECTKERQWNKKEHTVKVINTRLTLFRHSCRVCRSAIYLFAFLKRLSSLIDENDDLILYIFSAVSFAVLYIYRTLTFTQRYETKCPILMFIQCTRHIGISVAASSILTKKRAVTKRETNSTSDIDYLYAPLKYKMVNLFRFVILVRINMHS